jgi:hypothetical protein
MEAWTWFADSLLIARKNSQLLFWVVSANVRLTSFRFRAEIHG